MKPADNSSEIPEDLVSSIDTFLPELRATYLESLSRLQPVDIRAYQERLDAIHAKMKKDIATLVSSIRSDEPIILHGLNDSDERVCQMLRQQSNNMRLLTSAFERACGARTKKDVARELGVSYSSLCQIGVPGKGLKDDNLDKVRNWTLEKLGGNQV